MIHLNKICLIQTKLSLEQIKICSNQINFYLKSNNLYLSPYINAFISICFEEKFFQFKEIFIWPKDILFELNKCYLTQINLLFESKRAF